ncbi:MAG: DUF7146 domain-containing protein [Caulobacteraceae bacterium]
MTEPRPLPYDWKDVRHRLQRNLSAVLGALNIDAPIRGALCTPLNPRRADRRAGSFVIWCDGDRAGAWRDFACGEDCKGDVIDLIAYVEGLRARIDAYWRALEILGLGRGDVRTQSQAELDKRRAEEDRRAAEARRTADEEGKSLRLFAWWLRLPPIAGTLAETYLAEARGIDLSSMHTPGALRFCQRLEHIDARTGEVTYWPAMVAAMTRGAKVAGLHRTWLRPDGRGKAEVDTPKKMIGPVRGAAIRLASGPSKLSPAKAEGAGVVGPLAVGEGIETCLSVAAARRDYRVWAAGSLSLIGALEWPACASAVVLLRDNDDGFEAQRAFEGAYDAWARQAKGRPLEVVESAVGKDFNDWARAPD